jgi:hypothetical protein
MNGRGKEIPSQQPIGSGVSLGIVGHGVDEGDMVEGNAHHTHLCRRASPGRTSGLPRR